MGSVIAAAVSASATVLALQVLLPRLFSVLLWYHLAFLAVSLSMLGFALGGVLVRRAVERSGCAGGSLDRDRWLCLASLCIPGALALSVRLPLDTAALLSNPLDGLLLLIMVAALAAPFVALGTVICQALDLAGSRIGAVYGATFFGGALGALLTLGTMELLGAWRTPGVVALLPVLGCRRPVRPLPLLAVVLAVVSAVQPELVIPRASRKHFPQVPAERVLEEHSSATSDVIFYENPEHHGLWSAAALPDTPVPETVGVAIDAWAITFITKRDGPDDYPPLLEKHPAGLAFENTTPGFNALVIGAGGGWDVLSALAAGAGHVTAVELNPFIVEAVRGRWRAHSGELYHDPRVTAVVAEGRHFVDHDSALYDRVVLAGVDTFAATQAGAFALAENHLYTVEALETLLSRLKPGGVLCLTRWWFDPPRQTLRLLLTAAEALKRQGVPDPRRRIYLAHGGNALLFVKQGSDLTPAEIGRWEHEAEQRGASTLYAWGRPSHPVLVEALDAKDSQAWADHYPYRVDVTSDDRPFFFENGRLSTLFRAEGNWIHDRLGGQEILVATLLVLLLLSAPLLGSARSQAAGGLRTALPFLALGAGYLLVEVCAMQRLVLLLGHPVHAVAVVLVSLLSASGVGALLSRRMPEAAAPLAPLLAALTVTLTLVLGHEPLLSLLADQRLALRALGVALFLWPAGMTMGACFPLAVRRLSTHRNALLPSAFLWNGVASVLTGPVAVLLAMDQGFAVTQTVGAAFYLLAAAALLLIPKAGAATGASPAVPR